MRYSEKHVDMRTGSLYKIYDFASAILRAAGNSRYPFLLSRCPASEMSSWILWFHVRIDAKNFLRTVQSCWFITCSL